MSPPRAQGITRRRGTAWAERLPLLLLAALLRLGHRTIAGRLRLLLRHLEQRLLAAQRDLALAAHDAFALAGLQHPTRLHVVVQRHAEHFVEDALLELGVEHGLRYFDVALEPS